MNGGGIEEIAKQIASTLVGNGNIVEELYDGTEGVFLPDTFNSEFDVTSTTVAGSMV